MLTIHLQMRDFYSPLFFTQKYVGRALITPIILYLPKFDKSKNITVAGQFGNKIKELREQQNLLQRQVAAQLDVDTPLFSKIERGERTAKKELVTQLAQLLNADKNELLTLWLADQVFDVINGEENADEALKSVSKKIKKK